VVTLTTDRHERVAPGARLHDGRRWLVVTSSRPQGPGRFVVGFEGIEDRTAAEASAGRTLSAEPLVDAGDDDVLWVHELIGGVVVDAGGTERGTCTAVVDNPAADLLELDTGHLVPVTFVTGVDEAADGRRTIRVDAPEGLFDLLD